MKKLLSDLSKCGDEIESFLKKERISNSKYERVTNENKDIKVVIHKISTEKVTTSKQFEENIMMLENVLETRDQKIYNLEEDLKRDHLLLHYLDVKIV